MRRPSARRVLAVVGVVAGLAGAVVLVRLDARVRAYLRGPAVGGIRIYAAPATLRAGTPGAVASLRQRLLRVGYVEVATAPQADGEFQVGAHGIDLRPRGGARVHVAVGPDAITGLRRVDGDRPLDGLTLPPELLAVGGRGGALLESGGATVPDACRRAVLAAEDRHFFDHPGVDPLAIGRALLADLRAGERRQGGSTLTQQLAKNAFLSPRRTFGRKLREAVLAVLLEVHASKDELLRRYLDGVYLGSDRGLPVHGFAQGALVHLGRRVEDLDVAGCALLAGMIRSPNALAPRRHPDAARARRDRVLGLMVEAGLLDARVADAARATPVRLAPALPRGASALYVADEVGRELERILPGSARVPGLVVQTTIDAEAQRAAEHALRRRLDALDPGRRRRLEAALVAIEADTGRIRALVGGRDYAASPLDRAVRARRQPGSAFKPFVALAALDPRRTRPPRTVVSLLEDAPVAVRVPEGVWRPANHDGEYRGVVPLEDAMAWSLNAATVRLAQDVGVGAAAAVAHDLGVTTPLPEVPALALGAGEVSLLELTGAYAAIADGGVRRPPRLVDAVVAPDGTSLFAAAPRAIRVLDARVAYLVTHCREGVVDRGTGRPARAAGLRGPAAGKTGTTDDGRDAWFVGWTPDVVAGVWVGIDRGGGRTSLTGATGALPIWTEFVRAVARRRDGPRGFAEPPGLVWRDVDATTGLLATADCPAVRRTPFLPGTEPTATCARHRPLWTAVGDRVGDAGRAVESTGRRLGAWIRDLLDLE